MSRMSLALSMGQPIKRFCWELQLPLEASMTNKVFGVQESAMMSTMDSMMAPTGAPLSGDPDRDYAIMMSQHHQVRVLGRHRITACMQQPSTRVTS